MASRERDGQAMAGLLQRSSCSRAGAGDGPVPRTGNPRRLFRALARRGRNRAISSCTFRCARCREKLAAMGRAEKPLARSAKTPRRQPRTSWLWDWRWLAPVAAVLVLAAIWATRRPALTRHESRRSRAPWRYLSRANRCSLRRAPASRSRFACLRPRPPSCLRRRRSSRRNESSLEIPPPRNRERRDLRCRDKSSNLAPIFRSVAATTRPWNPCRRRRCRAASADPPSDCSQRSAAMPQVKASTVAIRSAETVNRPRAGARCRRRR